VVISGFDIQKMSQRIADTSGDLEQIVGVVRRSSAGVTGCAPGAGKMIDFGKNVDFTIGF